MPKALLTEPVMEQVQVSSAGSNADDGDKYDQQVAESMEPPSKRAKLEDVSVQMLVDAADLPSSYSLPSHAMETTDDVAFSSLKQGMDDDREASILPTATRTDAKVELEADAASAPPAEPNGSLGAPVDKHQGLGHRMWGIRTPALKAAQVLDMFRFTSVFR